MNWYGAHEDDGVAAGLERTGRRALARRIALSGATPIQVYDACVEALTDAGLIVSPNCHTLDAGWCCSESDESGMWFNDRWPAAKYFAAWQNMGACSPRTGAAWQIRRCWTSSGR